jgi:hypothetical protein
VKTPSDPVSGKPRKEQKTENDQWNGLVLHD